MTPQQELDLKVAAYHLGRSLEEIIFTTVHAEMVGPHRREEAMRTFGEAVVTIVKQIQA